MLTAEDYVRLQDCILALQREYHAKAAKDCRLKMLYWQNEIAELENLYLRVELERCPEEAPC